MQTTTTVALLESWKKVRGIASDYSAAKVLKVSQSTLSNWRHGRSHADVELAARMAEELDMEVIEVLAAIQADREPRAPAAAIWRRYGRPAFVALIASVLVPLAQPGEALGNVESANYTMAKNRQNNPLCEVVRRSWLARQAERLLNAVAVIVGACRGNLPLHPCFKSM